MTRSMTLTMIEELWHEISQEKPSPTLPHIETRPITPDRDFPYTGTETCIYYSTTPYHKHLLTDLLTGEPDYRGMDLTGVLRAISAITEHPVHTICVRLSDDSNHLSVLEGRLSAQFTSDPTASPLPVKVTLVPFTALPVVPLISLDGNQVRCTDLTKLLSTLRSRSVYHELLSAFLECDYDTLMQELIWRSYPVQTKFFPERSVASIERITTAEKIYGFAPICEEWNKTYESYEEAAKALGGEDASPDLIQRTRKLMEVSPDLYRSSYTAIYALRFSRIARQIGVEYDTDALILQALPTAPLFYATDSRVGRHIGRPEAVTPNASMFAFFLGAVDAQDEPAYLYLRESFYDSDTNFSLTNTLYSRPHNLIQPTPTTLHEWYTAGYKAGQRITELHDPRSVFQLACKITDTGGRLL
mgnify:CR=1 FL=1